DDWKGGTRIGPCLEEFNRHWARRVLGQNAAVLLVTDGLDRDGEGQLTAAAEHLHRMAHQIVWLNPLLRFDGFEPRAAGVRALLPHVDRFLPVHNLASWRIGTALRAPACGHLNMKGNEGNGQSRSASARASARLAQ
ncbi:MAG: VWA domain-containing protein, partial [Betaproteobacteria bacterium]|nr:VWA domain-containing protein [Betaproteobacteria bacterium]